MNAENVAASNFKLPTFQKENWKTTARNFSEQMAQMLNFLLPISKKSGESIGLRGTGWAAKFTQNFTFKTHLPQKAWLRA